ncbi:MAG: hypothetical protein M1824_002432 [Vezdaea acicularis]|nr:MAG: hypothetical protein M1824_002432 [Vezdaea acicularis]
MGFTTGFIAGLTLPLLIASLSLSTHLSNRYQQRQVLRQQALLLTSTIDRDLHDYHLPERPARQEYEGVDRILESAKERWNSEVRGIVRWAQNVDLGNVGREVDGIVRGVWERVRRAGE